MSQKEKLFQDPQPKLPALTPKALLVLRRVRAGDPFRDKAPGLHGRVKRAEELLYLQQRGLVHMNRAGLWGVTKAGRAYLAAHPIR